MSSRLMIGEICKRIRAIELKLEDRERTKCMTKMYGT